ncbi:MAG: IS30 family transposase [Tomitella sp.]|nr:IS30 family transposase [Tomitella sp.]
MADRAQIAVGIKSGQSDAEIGEMIDRDSSVVWRERKRNSTKTRGYQPVGADCAAEGRRRRPQARKIDADPVLAERVRTDLRRSRTPRQIAGRLRLEASDDSVDTMVHSSDAEGRIVSHEAIYRWIYALPKGELAKSGILLRSKRTRRKPRKALGERAGGRIVGMVSIDDRPDEAADRRVPGSWEGDLIIGKAGKSAAATLVERASRFTLICGLPAGKTADGLADVLIDTVSDLPKSILGSLTWDQGTEMARHAAVTVATDLPVYFAHPHSPWERGTNENTNGLIREYLPKGTEITDHQPYLNAIADELNDRPRAVLGFLTPREVFTQLLAGSIASTN